MTGLAAFRDDESLRRFANAALGKDKKVISVILSHFQTAWRDWDVDCKRFVFIDPSNGEMLRLGTILLWFPSSVSTA